LVLGVPEVVVDVPLHPAMAKVAAMTATNFTLESPLEPERAILPAQAATFAFLMPYLLNINTSSLPNKVSGFLPFNTINVINSGWHPSSFKYARTSKRILT
jgi:hypothetical protein